MSFLTARPEQFKTTLEVVPPEGHDPGPLLSRLKKIAHLPFDGFSVASNPVARPRMSAMAFAHLIQQETGKPAILHMTVRDHNRLGLQAELWGARALGIETVIAVTGDPSGRDTRTSTVNDLNVLDLITMVRDAGIVPGAVLDFRPEKDGLDHEIGRMKEKQAAGGRFIVTQPVYDRETAERIKRRIDPAGAQVILGILPLLSFRHARFLDRRVTGISIPSSLMAAMEASTAPVQTGIENARQMLDIAREYFSGACIMPPFDRFDIMPDIL